MTTPSPEISDRTKLIMSIIDNNSRAILRDMQTHQLTYAESQQLISATTAALVYCTVAVFPPELKATKAEDMIEAIAIDAPDLVITMLDGD